MKVLITSNSFGTYDNSPRQQMTDLGWELIENRYKHIMNEEEMMEEVKGIDAIILGSDTVSKKVLEQADRLQIISRYGVGIDNIDLEEAKRRNIAVTVTKNSNSAAVADYTLGLMLATLRHICSVNSNLKQGVWKKETGLDLCDKVVGVFGLGSIGKEVVQRLKGFGCTILGYDAFIDETYCKEHNITMLTPEEIFAKADVITLHMPGMANGASFIGEKELQLMKPTTVIINTARASLIDEEAIIKACTKRQIYGYGTDVFANEPEMNEAFRTLGNVVVSPHTAAVSVEAVNKMSSLAVQNLIDFFERKE